MPIPSSMKDLSAIAASNSPAGTDALSTVDDHIRALAAIVRQEQTQASSMASASTVDVGAAAGSYLHITGTTTINSLGSTGVAGIERTLVFDGTLTLTNSASLVLNGENITTTAGDSMTFRCEGSGVWRLVNAKNALKKITVNSTLPALTVTQSGYGAGLSMTGGNLVFGTSGTGIDFSSSATGGSTSNILDAYEEGTFGSTVHLSDAASGGNNATYGGRTANYTKIGDTVFAKITFTNITTTGMTAGNSVYVTGLPFTSGAGTNHFTPNSCWKSNISTSAGGIIALIGSNQAYAVLYEDSVGGNALLIVSDITSGTADLSINITYKAA